MNAKKVCKAIVNVQLVIVILTRQNDFKNVCNVEFLTLRITKYRHIITF